jgi:mRNA interferase RelE/StbE
MGRLAGPASLRYCKTVHYRVQLKPRAVKDLGQLPRRDAARVLLALERLQVDLSGDVKRLTDFTPEYRLRVGNYRVLFEIEQDSTVTIYRILHRREAYR